MIHDIDYHHVICFCVGDLILSILCGNTWPPVRACSLVLSWLMLSLSITGLDLMLCFTVWWLRRLWVWSRGLWRTHWRPTIGCPIWARIQCALLHRTRGYQVLSSRLLLRYQTTRSGWDSKSLRKWVFSLTLIKSGTLAVTDHCIELGVWIIVWEQWTGPGLISTCLTWIVGSTN